MRCSCVAASLSATGIRSQHACGAHHASTPAPPPTPPHTHPPTCLSGPLPLCLVQARRPLQAPPWPAARAFWAPGVAWLCWRGPTPLPRAVRWAGRYSRRRWRSAQSAWQAARGWWPCVRAGPLPGRPLSTEPLQTPRLSGIGMVGCRPPHWAFPAQTMSFSRPDQRVTAELAPDLAASLQHFLQMEVSRSRNTRCRSYCGALLVCIAILRK